jgi:hypothetical protein
MPAAATRTSSSPDRATGFSMLRMTKDPIDSKRTAFIPILQTSRLIAY